MTDTPRRRSRWLRRIVQVSLLLFLLGVVRQWWRYSSTVEQGRRDLAAVLSEIDATDPRWRWADLEADRPDLPDEENSLVAVKQHLQAWDAIYGPRIRLGSGPPNLLFDPMCLNILSDSLAPKRDSTTRSSLVRALRERPRGNARFSPAADVVSTALPHLRDCREALDLLVAEHERHLVVGRTHAAVECVHAILHLGAALRHDALFDPQELRDRIRNIARNRTIRLLGISEPSEDDLTSLQAHFEAEASESLLRTALRGERAAWHEWYEHLHRGNLPLGPTVETFPVEPRPTLVTPPSQERIYVTGVLYRQHLDEDHAVFLRLITEAVAFTDLPTEQQSDAWVRLGERFNSLRIQEGDRHRLAVKVLDRLFGGQFSRLPENCLVQRARFDCLCAALAAERFRKAHQRWPHSLEELVPRYLSAVPSAAHTGDPLRFEARPDGVLIYSPRPGLTREEQVATIGYGFRLWDASHRRLLLPELPRRDGDPPPPPPEPHQ
jgi:hypothetical protein